MEDPIVRARVDQMAVAVADLAYTLNESDRARLLTELVTAVGQGAQWAAADAQLGRSSASRREHYSLLMVADAAVEHASSFGA